MGDQKETQYGIVSESVDPRISGLSLKTSNPGVLDTVSFEARIKYAQTINQLSYILVIYNPAQREEIIDTLQSMTRLTDCLTVIKSGHIVMLIHRQQGIKATETVVAKIKEVLSEFDDVTVSGLFMPYAQLELPKVFRQLLRLSKTNLDVDEVHAHCHYCEVDDCPKNDDPNAECIASNNICNDPK